jgi:hypothetical protein
MTLRASSFSFKADSAGATERVTISNAGDVGIGSTTPKAALDIIDSSAARVYLGTSASNYGGLVYSSGVMSMRGIGNGSAAVVSADATNSEITFTTAGVADRMTIDGSGNVDIANGLTVNGAFTSRGIDDNADATAITIDSSERVGIKYTGSNLDPLRVGLADGEGLSIGTRDQDGTYYLGMKQTTSQWNNSGHLKWEQTGNTNDLTINVGGGDLKFITSNQPYNERMRIDSSGNVGIGTDTPNTTVEISGTADFGTANTGGLLSVRNTATGADAAIKLYSVADNTGSGNNGAISFDAGSNGTGTTNRLNFTADAQTSTAPMMTINGSGNVGISTSAPNFNTLDSNANGLHIQDDQYAALRLEGPASDFYLTSGSTGHLLYGRGAVPMAFHTDTIERMRIASTGNVGIGESNPGANLDIKDATKATLRLNHTGSNSWDIANDSNLTFTRGTSEAMRIDSSGNLLVGTTAPIGAGASGVTVADISNAIGQVSIAKTYSGTTSAMKLYYGSTQVGRIDYSDTSTDYVTSSDERLKKNVVDAPAGNIDSIKVRSFDWKTDDTHQEYGFIAQELETVAPYAVSKGETDEDTWGVDYSKLVPMLVKEIQDLKAEVEALKNA